MKVHLIELFAQFAITFFTIFEWVVTNFLQDFNDVLALFTLVLIYGHWCLQAFVWVAC